MNMYRVGTLLCAALFLAARSKAAFALDFEQVGSNVIATGSGSLDLTGLTHTGFIYAESGINANIGLRCRWRA